MSRKFFEWIGRNIRPITLVVLGLTVVAVPLAASRNENQPKFEPSGEIYKTFDLADEIFVSASPVQDVTFIVEAKDDDALTKDVLLEVKQNSDAVRADSRNQGILTDDFSLNFGVQIDGIYSLADEVDAALPGGLAGANDADVKTAIGEILGTGDEGSPLRRSLSQQATLSDGVWRSPAFIATMVFDESAFADAGQIDTFGQYSPDSQPWLRDVQDTLRGDQNTFRAFGIALDPDATFEEQIEAASPFILLAVVGIMLLVGLLLRSYWAAAVVAIGLSISMFWYHAATNLLGFQTGSLLLGFVVPISAIAFGVDFFVHASGRAREEQVHGATRERSYPLGLGAVIAALGLAVGSSMAAFISNAVAGIEAIVEFGIGAALALFFGFITLGLLAPKVLLSIEDYVGNPPADRGRRIPQRLGFLGMALVAGVTVTMAVVLPAAGAVSLVVFGVLVTWLPARIAKKRYAKAAAAGREPQTAIEGAGHGLKLAGSVVHFLAKWRIVTVPVTIVLAVLGIIGFTKVESEFTFSDFFSEDTDFIISLDLFDEHLGQTQGAGSGFVYVEGDLTDPAALVAIRDAEAQVTAADAASPVPFLSRDLDGEVVVEDNAVTIVETAVASATTTADIEASTGVAITDADGDGLPDSSDQIMAIYDHAYSAGITTDEGFVAFDAAGIPELLVDYGDGRYATLLEFGIPTLTDNAIILDARSALEDADAALESGPASGAFTFVSASGETITQQDSLDAFTEAMIIALPIALILCALISAVFMRSIRYGLVAISPIVLVVGWVYGFMFIAGFKINPVTATIAAIAVGVGIDYSTHFTMRFREEYEDEPSRFPALRRAGEGTGGALAISAGSSIIGFAVMAFAPMPIFATFGVLTAVMIVFSLAVALFVLPSLLLLVTRKRSRLESDLFVVAKDMDPEEYEQHSRETALRTRPTSH